MLFVPGLSQTLHRHRAGPEPLFIMPFNNKGQCALVALAFTSSRTWLSMGMWSIPFFVLDFSHALEFASPFVWSGMPSITAQRPFIPCLFSRPGLPTLGGTTLAGSLAPCWFSEEAVVLLPSSTWECTCLSSDPCGPVV